MRGRRFSGPKCAARRRTALSCATERTYSIPRTSDGITTPVCLTGQRGGGSGQQRSQGFPLVIAELGGESTLDGGRAFVGFVERRLAGFGQPGFQHVPMPR